MLVRRRGPGTAMCLALLAVVLGACRMDVDTRVAVEPTGSGTLAVDVVLDDDLVQSLTATGFDPTPTRVPGWDVERVAVDGGERISIVTTFDDPDELSQRVDELAAGLDDEDPGLVESVDLELAEDGSSELAATVGLRLPSSTGVEGPGFADGQDLAALAADPEKFGATFSVELPGPVTAPDADRIDGTTATWNLVPGEVVEVRASAGPPDPFGTWVVPAVGIGVLVLLVLLGAWLLRRRRRERNRAPHGRVERMRRWST